MTKKMFVIFAKGFLMTSVTLMAIAEAFYFAYDTDLFSGPWSLVLFFGVGITVVDIAYILVMRSIKRLLDKEPLKKVVTIAEDNAKNTQYVANNLYTQVNLLASKAGSAIDTIHSIEDNLSDKDAVELRKVLINLREIEDIANNLRELENHLKEQAETVTKALEECK